jgi:hypothetical protein
MISTIRVITYVFSVIVLVLGFKPTMVLAQSFMMGTPVNTMDSKAVFSNPAVISFQPSHVAFGLKGHHAGYFDSSILEYQKGYLTVSAPRVLGTKFGSAMNLQYFNSPIFSRSQVGTTLSYQMMPNVSLGANASILYMGYNRANFVDFDFDDPVFSGGFSRLGLNSSVGIYTRPIPIVEIGAGVRNLNQPDVALGGQRTNLPMEPFAAASVRFGPLRGTFELVNTEKGLENRSHVELYSTNGYYGRFGSNTNFDNGYVELQARLFSGYSVNYQYELPSRSMMDMTSGSHMFSMIFEFKRRPNLPTLRRLDAEPPPFIRLAGVPNIPSVIFLSNDTEYLRINEINITRTMDDSTLTASDLRALSAYDLGVLGEYPGYERVPYKDRFPIEMPMSESIELATPLTNEYEQFLASVRDFVAKQNGLSLDILIRDGDEVRGAGLKNLLTRDIDIPISISNILLSNSEDSLLFATPFDLSMLQTEQLVKAEPEMTVIKPLFLENVVSSRWWLRVFDNNETMIREITNEGQIPNEIEWDWKDNQGRYPQPGAYYYSLHWLQNNTTTEYATRRRIFYIQKNFRNITVVITKDPSRLLPDADSVNIILKKQQP